ncbi:chorismate mutase, partial [Bittarella massiliensis (ex Durand et al. 2017)]|nr:chorismate mutase [Bittarella massiliensis (ex Durand et al. 2017)]
MELDKLREEIDQIDRELLSLFCRRMEVVAQVGQYKKERGLPVLNQGREDAISGGTWARARARMA